MQEVKQGQEPSQGCPKAVGVTADQNGARVRNREADSTGRAGVQTQTGNSSGGSCCLFRGVTKGSLSEHTAPVLSSGACAWDHPGGALRSPAGKEPRHVRVFHEEFCC